MSNPIISVEGVSHLYSDRLALNNVSFQIGKGEVFCFLGPNGGGKTTMFKILSTVITPTSGRAIVCGHDVVTESAEVRKHIGVVFQSPSLDLKTDCKGEFALSRIVAWTPRTRSSNRIDDTLRNLHLEDRRNEIVEKLSGGLQRRVEIGKGLLPSPDVLILDEPSTGLDPGARIDLWDYLLELRNTSGITIVVTSHILSEAEHSDGWPSSTKDSGRS